MVNIAQVVGTTSSEGFRGFGPRPSPGVDELAAQIDRAPAEDEADLSPGSVYDPRSSHSGYTRSVFGIRNPEYYPMRVYKRKIRRPSTVALPAVGPRTCTYDPRFHFR